MGNGLLAAAWKIADDGGNGYYLNTANTPYPPADGWQIDGTYYDESGIEGPAPAPTLTGDVTTNSVIVTAADVSPSSIPPGGPYKVIQLSFSAVYGSPAIASVAIHGGGTATYGTGNDIPNAALYNTVPTDLDNEPFSSGRRRNV